MRLTCIVARKWVVTWSQTNMHCYVYLHQYAHSHFHCLFIPGLGSPPFNVVVVVHRGNAHKNHKHNFILPYFYIFKSKLLNKDGCRCGKYSNLHNTKNNNSDMLTMPNHYLTSRPIKNKSHLFPMVSMSTKQTKLKYTNIGVTSYFSLL